MASSLWWILRMTTMEIFSHRKELDHIKQKYNLSKRETNEASRKFSNHLTRTLNLWNDQKASIDNAIKMKPGVIAGNQCKDHDLHREIEMMKELR